MFGAKYDGVVEAVHYTPQGQIAWVRAYERRGPTWSDHVLIDRQTLVDRLQSGKRFYAGKRLEFQASEFDLGAPLKLLGSKQGSHIITNGSTANKDDLSGVPVV
ncbi:MAG: hypothetical protein OEZ02_05070 [Anaerolineae bacterium]|nr:hypothetical protein [Anaerolineae bacterium]